MEDQFAWLHGGAYIVLAGSRNQSLRRRCCPERRGHVARGMFAVHAVDRRGSVDRRRIPDRREENGVFTTIVPSDKFRLTISDCLLLAAGILLVMLGVLISQTISVALGLFVGAGSLFLVAVHGRRLKRKP